jgi:hypothetical protein
MWREKYDTDDRQHTHEEIVCIGTPAADTEEFFEIHKLAMDVPTYLGWGGGCERLNKFFSGNDQYDRTERVGLMERTVTGESIHCTFDSSTRISRAFRHSSFTCASLMISHRFSFSICLIHHPSSPNSFFCWFIYSHH